MWRRESSLQPVAFPMHEGALLRNTQAPVNAVCQTVETGGRLDGFLDLTASEAAGTHANAPGGSSYDGADTLKIGVEHPFGLVIGVTHVMAGLMLL